MNTFNRLWNVKTPAEAQQKIEQQINSLNINEPANLENRL